MFSDPVTSPVAFAVPTHDQPEGARGGLWIGIQTRQDRKARGPRRHDGGSPTRDSDGSIQYSGVIMVWTWSC